VGPGSVEFMAVEFMDGEFMAVEFVSRRRSRALEENGQFSQEDRSEP